MITMWRKPYWREPIYAGLASVVASGLWVYFERWAYIIDSYSDDSRVGFGFAYVAPLYPLGVATAYHAFHLIWITRRRAWPRVRLAIVTGLTLPALYSLKYICNFPWLIVAVVIALRIGSIMRPKARTALRAATD